MISYTLVDALTENAFEGDPCAVCTWGVHRSNRLMQSIATELAVPDTVFLASTGPGSWQPHFFSPYQQEEMSTHALLAAAHTVLGHHDVGFFESNGHRWKVTRNENTLTLVEPEELVTPCPMSPLLESLGSETPIFVGQTENDWWVECRSIEDVDVILECDHGLLHKLFDKTPKHGLVITSEYDSKVVAKHVIKRGWHIIERPIGARAHRALLSFWSERLGINQLTLNGIQLDMPLEKNIRLTSTCVDSFVGTFLNIQGQINLESR